MMGCSRRHEYAPTTPNGWLLLLGLGWLLIKADQSLAASVTGLLPAAGETVKCGCPQECPAGTKCMSKENGYVLKKAEPCAVPGTCECVFLPNEFVKDCIGAFCCKDGDSCSPIRVERYWAAGEGGPVIDKSVKGVPEEKWGNPCESVCTTTHGPGSDYWTLWVNRMPSNGFPVCQGRVKLNTAWEKAQKQKRRDALYKVAIESGLQVSKNCNLCTPGDDECNKACVGQFDLHKNKDQKDLIALIFLAIVCVMFLFGVFKMTCSKATAKADAESANPAPAQPPAPASEAMIQRPTEEQLNQAREDPEAASRMGLPNASEQAAIARNDPEAARLMGIAPTEQQQEPTIVQASVVGMPMEGRDAGSDTKPGGG